jgi:hypothetical protein
MASLDPPPCFMGGYAEDALVAGAVTRPHGDLDWIFPRRELDLRLAQAEQLKFSGFSTQGEAAPGVPFYLQAEAGEVQLDLGVADEEDGWVWMKVHRLLFEVDGQEAPAGYRARLADDTFDHPPVALEGVEIRTASPLALYQVRIAIAGRGSFGQLPDRQRESSRLLREKFFPGRPAADIEPLVEPLG